MSSLTSGDEALHYGDNSHRWEPPWPPDPVRDPEWIAAVRMHVEAHRDQIGNKARPGPGRHQWTEGGQTWWTGRYRADGPGPRTCNPPGSYRAS